MSAMERLLADGTGPLSQSTPRLTEECSELAGTLTGDLLGLPWMRNEFFAFDSALHVIPVASEVGVLGLARWNAESRWRS
jgi:hypothetical protein